MLAHFFYKTKTLAISYTVRTHSMSNEEKFGNDGWLEETDLAV